jgi:hypothetical protein
VGEDGDHEDDAEGAENIGESDAVSSDDDADEENAGGAVAATEA